jgi:hypothetical protein
MFSIYLTLPAALGPEVYSASNRKQFQKHKNNVFGSRARPVHRADNLVASVSLLSKQCGILNISQPNRPPRPVTEDSFTFFFYFYSKLMVTISPAH